MDCFHLIGHRPSMFCFQELEKLTLCDVLSCLCHVTSCHVLLYVIQLSNRPQVSVGYLTIRL